MLKNIMIQTHVINTLLERLRVKGWKQNGGYAIRGNPRVLGKGGRTIIVVLPVNIDPQEGVNSQVDDFFRSLMKIADKLTSTDVFLPEGGSIPVPPFFIDFCKGLGIKIHYVDIDSLPKYDKWE